MFRICVEEVRGVAVCITNLCTEYLLYLKHIQR